MLQLLQANLHASHTCSVTASITIKALAITRPATLWWPGNKESVPKNTALDYQLQTKRNPSMSHPKVGTQKHPEAFVGTNDAHMAANTAETAAATHAMRNSAPSALHRSCCSTARAPRICPSRLQPTAMLRLTPSPQPAHVPAAAACMM